MNKKKPRNNCLNCGKEVKRPKDIYCNNKCQQEYRWKLTKAEIIKNKSFQYSTSMRIAKRFLLERDGNICSVCKLQVWLGKPIPLILDHIDGNSNNLSVVNYRLVCGNCDMQLPTYKIKNLGMGRYYRRKRYKEGKSY